MKLFTVQFWILILTAATVLSAAFYDYKWRRIPNFITFPAIALGLLMHGVRAGGSGVGFSLWGLTAGGGIFLIIYLAGGIGAGDVKLLGSVGALLGAEKISAVLILTVFIGGLMAMVKLASNYSCKNISNLLRYSSANVSRKIHSAIHRMMIDPLQDTLPYGVAIAMGTLITLL